MIRRVVFVLVFVASVFLVARAEDKPIRFDQLPKQAQEFVHKHFKGTDVSLVMMDNEVFSTSYEVRMRNGVSVDFDKFGRWTEIDGNTVMLPVSVIPSKINVFVNTKHPDSKVVKISRDRRHYEVELDNTFELIFDLKTMKFKRYDN